MNRFVIFLPAALSCLLLSAAGCNPEPKAAGDLPKTEVSATAPATAPALDYSIVETLPDGSMRVEYQVTRMMHETRVREVIDANGKSTEEPVVVAVPVAETRSVLVPAGMDVATFLADQPKELTDEGDFRAPNEDSFDYGPVLPTSGDAPPLPPAPESSDAPAPPPA